MSVLPPVRIEGLQCIGLFQDQHQKLVHLQQEAVGAVLWEEANQQPVLVLTQGLLVLLRDSHEWILKYTGNTWSSQNNDNNPTLLNRTFVEASVILLWMINVYW